MSVFSFWMCQCFAMWHWSASQRSPVWVWASMRSSLLHFSPWPCVSLNRSVKQEMWRFTTVFKDLKQHLNLILVLTDASFEHQYSTRLCQWKGRWAEFHPEPQSLPLYLPERAWTAHWEAAEPQRDVNGGMKDAVQCKMLHLWIFALAFYRSCVDHNQFLIF